MPQIGVFSCLACVKQKHDHLGVFMLSKWKKALNTKTDPTWVVFPCPWCSEGTKHGNTPMVGDFHARSLGGGCQTRKMRPYGHVFHVWHHDVVPCWCCVIGGGGGCLGVV